MCKINKTIKNMKRIIYLSLALALTMSLSSCFSDDSSLSTEAIGDITVLGIEDSYSNVAYMGEYLDITPQVESNEEMTYSWLLLSDKSGTDDEQGNEIQPEVIGHDKDLHYEINLVPGVYQVRLEAKGKSGYTVYKKTSLTVRTTFSQGFYVLKENSEGNTDIDLITLDGKTGNDIISTIDGKALNGKPMSLGTLYEAYYVNPDDDKMTTANMVYVTTEKGQFRIARSTDLRSVFDRSNLMYDKMDESEYPYFFVTTVFYNGMMTNKGIYQTPIMNGETTGQYGLPVATCGASRYALSDKSSYGGLFWDSTNHNLTTYDWNFTTAPLLKDDFSGEDLTQNLTDYDCLSCGYNKLPSGATGVIVMCNKVSGKRYLYLTEGSFSGIVLKDYKPIREDSHAAKASYFGLNGITASYLYCVDAGHLYAMNFNDENMNEIELKPEDIGSGENIVFVANQFWNASGSSDDKFNYLIVGTQSGDNYKLYFYNINGGAPDGKPLMTKEGKGKVKCIRFLNTKYSGGGMSSNLDYNTND